MIFYLKYILRQILEIRAGGLSLLLKKLQRPTRFIYDRLVIKVLYPIPFLPVILMIRVIQPIIVFRLCRLHSLKLGHLTVNTEIHLCEKSADLHISRCRYVDFYFYAHRIICNMQLAKMWEREILILPRWFMEPLFNANRLIPGGSIHEVDVRSQSGRDEHGLLNKSKTHIAFTPEEEKFGVTTLNNMGITHNDKFVCVIFRDHAYFDDLLGLGKDARDGYRNSDIKNFFEAAEELSLRGYYVLRMGKRVEQPFISNNKRIIDYASSPYRSDFMDIYLGAKCTFAVSTGTGWDGIPQIFRRPICYVNLSPLGYSPTSRVGDLFIPKHHFSITLKRELSLREIFECGADKFAHSGLYAANGIVLVENTPEELRDVVIEMDEKIRRVWSDLSGDDLRLQNQFRIIFREGIETSGISHLHGEFMATISAVFLRKNEWWLKRST